MSDETPVTPTSQGPEPDEASPPDQEASAQTAPSPAAPVPAPPPGRIWDRAPSRTLFIVAVVLAVWAIAATAFAFTGHHDGRFRLDRHPIMGRRFEGTLGGGNRLGGRMGNWGGGFNIVCPNGVYPPQMGNASNAPLPTATPSGSPGQTVPYGPGISCRITLPGWSQSIGSAGSNTQG